MKSSLNTVLQQGMQLIQRGQYQDAERIFGTALKQHPKQPDLLHFQGIVQSRLGKHAEGVRLIRKAIKLAPKVGGYHRNLALLLTEQGKKKEAVSTFKRAILLDSKDSQSCSDMGVVLSELGRREEAIEAYRKALKRDARNVMALNNMGNDLLKEKCFEEAADTFQQAIDLQPQFADAHSGLGNAYEKQGNSEQALKCFEQAISLGPNCVEAWCGRGNILEGQDRWEEAIESYSRAIQINPKHVESYNGRGGVLRDMHRPVDALRDFDRAILIEPDCLEAHSNRGGALSDQGRLIEAIESYNRAIQLDSARAELFGNRGYAWQGLGKYENALKDYDRAIAVDAEIAELHTNRGSALAGIGRLDEAIESYDRAIAVNPEYAAAYNNRGNAWKELGLFEKAIDDFNRVLSLDPVDGIAQSNRAGVIKDSGRLEEGIKEFREVAALSFSNSVTYSNYCFALNYSSELSLAEIFQAHIGYEERFGHVQKIEKSAVGGGERLRVGYVSPDFREHSVAYFFEPLLLHHDQTAVEVYCYYNSWREDEVTQRIKSHSNHWRVIAGVSDEDAVEMIKRDQIDILVDLAGHTANNRLPLFIYRPAPVQVTWLGYPNTTGLKSIGYRFTDDVADPVGLTERYHSEELVRLPTGFLCYQGDDSIHYDASLPADERGYVTFGSFNNLSKVTEQVVKLWSEILLSMPNSRLLLKTKQFADEKTRQRYLRLFTKEGVAEERIEIYAQLPKKEDHLALYGSVDIGLDPFPYNGTTTTCEALWMGVPVITMAGDRHAARVGASIMTHVGLEMFVAEDREQYVELAVQFASSLQQLREIRGGLRGQMKKSPLCDNQGFVRGVEKAYQEMANRHKGEPTS